MNVMKSAWPLPALALRWPAPSVWVAVALGLCLALAIVSWPVPGMLAPLGLAAVVLVVRQPHFLMVAFAVSLAVPIQHSLAGLPVNATDGLLVLWLLLLPGLSIWQRARRCRACLDTRWHVPSIVWFILPFVVAVVLAQLGSINPSASIKQVMRVIEWFVLLPVLLSSLLPDARFQRFMGVALMVVPCLFAIDGMVEYLNNGRGLTGMLGISVPVPEGGDQQIRHTFDVSGRAGSTFGGAQGLAMYLVMSMSLAMAHIARPPVAWLRGLALVCLAICLGGLMVAKSRGGLLGGLAVLVVMTLALRPQLKVVGAVGLLMALLISALALGMWPSWDGSLQGLVPGRPEAVLDRLIIWGKVLEVASQNPLFGVGLGNFRDAFFASEPWLHVELGYPSLHAHNTYLELLADTGIVGLSAYACFIVLVVGRLRQRWTEPGGGSVFTLAAMGSLGAYLVFAAVDMLLLQNMHMLLVMILSLGLTQPWAARLGVSQIAPQPAIGVRAAGARP